MATWGIIGGSGFENFEQVTLLETCEEPTPFGPTSAPLKKIQVGEHTAWFLSRHGQHHEKLPTEIPFLENIYQFKRLGVEQVLSFSAVGSLREECKPGDLVVPHQFIDRTKGVRQHTFCGNGVVGHTSLAHPACPYWTNILQKRSSQFDFAMHFEKTAVCMEGPAFSTRAESLMYQHIGGDIIGMTSFPEYALIREAGMGYVPCSFVTDYDCWREHEKPVTLAEIIAIMKHNNDKAFAILSALLAEPSPGEAVLQYNAHSLKTGLMTPWEAISEEQKAWLEVLCR